MTKAITFTYSYAQENCKQITTALMAFCLVLTLGYAINIYTVVSHTVALKQVSTEIVSANTSVQKMDVEYAALSRKITPETIAAHGFDSGKAKIFITRTSSLGQVSFAGHEF
ncbi:MAG: hypothetical protein M3Q80_01095 [bacterium]|nr:hypothetical protein [bacterium]